MGVGRWVVLKEGARKQETANSRRGGLCVCGHARDLSGVQAYLLMLVTRNARPT